MKNTISFRPSPPRVLLFSALVEEFSALQRAHVSKATTARMALACSRLLDYAGNGLLCANVNKDLLARYARYLWAELGLSAATINNHLRAISPVIKYGVSRGHIPEDFTIPYIR